MLRDTAIDAEPADPAWPNSMESDHVGPQVTETAPAMSDAHSRYHPVGAPRWRVLAVTVLVHIGLFYVAVTLDMVPLAKLANAPMMVDLIPVEAPPPPDPVAEPVERPLTLASPEPVRITAPPPIVQVPTPPVVAATVQRPEPAPPPPPMPAVVAAPSIVTVNDLGARLLKAKSPTYPIESRRKREQGVVVLRVTVSEQGQVEDLAIERTSGHERLDKAALAAVRGWRWSPTVANGAPVRVRGLVRIPFELTS